MSITKIIKLKKGKADLQILVFIKIPQVFKNKRTKGVRAFLLSKNAHSPFNDFSARFELNKNWQE